MSRTVSFRLRAVGALACLVVANLALIPDIQAQQPASSSVPSTLKPAASSSFIVAPSLSLGYAPTSLASGQLANSGNLDLVTADSVSGQITVFVGRGNGAFAPGETYTAGAQPSSLALADLNGDGNLDVVLANESDATISIFPGNGDGSLGNRTTLAVGFKPSFVALGDFTGKGHSDIAVAGRSGSTLAILQNDGSGNFGAPLNFALAQTPSALTAADFNQDGHLDLAFANPDGSVTVWLGSGNGQFKKLTPIATGSGPLTAITPADINRDGRIDLVVTSSAQNSVQVLLGNGNGSFAIGSISQTGNSPASSYAADVNGDGIPDLVVVNQGSNTFSVLSGRGDGTFSAAAEFVVGNGPLAAVVGSFYGNAHADIVTIDNVANSLSVPAGNGDGTFGAARSYAVGDQPVAAASADLDGNGTTDLAVTNYCNAGCSSSGGVAILLAGAAGVYELSGVYPMGAGSVSVALVDVNGDGKPDLISINRIDKTLSLRLGTGGGSFGALSTTSLSAAPLTFAFGDFNKDGKQDVAVLEDCGAPQCAQPGQVEVLQGTGSGGFQTTALIAVGYAPVGMASGPTRSSGATDLVVANRCGADASCESGGTATVLLSDGKGGFANGTSIPVGAGTAGIALADLNGSGTQNLIVTRNSDNSVAVFPGTGTGTFNAAVTYAVGNAPGPLAIADFNGDGIPDVAVANATDSTVTVLYGTGSGTLQPAAPIAVNTAPVALTAISGPAHTAAGIATVNGVTSGVASGSRLTVVSNVHARPDVGTNTTTLVLTVGPPASTTVNSTTAVALSLSVQGSDTTGVPGGGTVTITGNDTAATVFCTGSLPAAATGSTSTFSCTTTSLNGGVTTLTASYDGDTNYAANSTSANVTVTPLAPTISVLDNPSTQTAVNTSVSFTASLTGVTLTPVPPTGTMTISLNGTLVSGCSGPVNAAGQSASCSITNLTAGTNAISAAYTSDPSYVQPTAGSVNHVVTAATPAISISPNVPSASVNTPVTFTATLTGATFTPVAPSGTMTFSLNGTLITTAGCGGTISASGASQCTIANMSAGSNTVTATYSGDTNFVPAAPGSLPYSVSALTPTISMVPSVASSSVNTSVTFTASLAGVTLTPVTPNGTMTFSLNGTPITTAACGGSVSASGTSQCAIANMNAGSNLVTVAYSGDTNFVPASPGSLPFSVSTVSPNFTVIPAPSTPAQVTAGSTVTFYAQLGGGNPFTPVNPKGTVAFSLNSVAVSSCQTQSVSTVSGVWTAQCAIPSLPSGNDNVTATYGADTNFIVAAPASYFQNVIQAVPTLTLSSSPAATTFVNHPTSFTAVVAAPSGQTGAPIPSGNVTFKQGSNVLCGGPQGLSVPTLPLSATNQASATCTNVTFSSSSSSVPIVAMYSGDTNFSAGNQPTINLTVSPDGTKTTFNTTGSPVVNGTVTISTVVAASDPGSAVPQGTVSFSSNATPAPTGTCTTGVTLAADGSAPTCTLVFGAAGTDGITATFNPVMNGNFATSTVSGSLTIGQAGAPLVLSTNVAGPSVNQQVTLTASFTPAINGTLPSGSITFVDASNSQTLCTAAFAQSVTCQPAFASVGPHSITATLAKDLNFASSTSNPVVESVVQTATTTNVVAAFPNSSVNEQVQFTASVAPNVTGTTTPTGSVTFNAALGAQTLVLCGAAKNLSAVAGVPTATCTDSLPANGNWAISATYSGDTNFNAGTSAGITESVGKTAVTLAGIAATMTTQVNGSVTFTATIASTISGATIPGGTVSFSDGGAALCGSGVAVAPTGTAGTVSASCAETFALAGSHNVTVTYSGDGNFAGGSTASVVSVAATPTGVTISSSSPASKATQAVIFTAVVSPALKGAISPTGTVTFTSSDGTLNAVCGAVTVSQRSDGTSIANCQAAFPHNPSLPGQITVNAAYTSDLNSNGVGNFGPNSGAAAQTVQDFTANVTVTPTAGSTDPSSSKGIILTQGYGTAASTSPAIAPDPFNAAGITVTIESTGSFNDPLNASCSVVSNTTNAAVTDPTCSLSNSTPSGANGTTLTYLVSASAKAPVDSYSVTVTFADPALTTLSQATAAVKVFVVGQSASLALGTGGATGNEAALFLTPTPLSGTPTISCPQIWDTVNLKVLSNAGSSLITCTGPAGTVSENGLVTTVPISISTNGSSAMLSHGGSSLYLAGAFGVPLLALVGLIGGSKSRRKRVLRYLYLAVLAWGIASASGCGGSFNRPPAPTTSGIPAGNYLVQVVATDSTGSPYYAEVPLVVNAQ